MFSSSDLPSCPACGCREVHAIPIFSTRIREPFPSIEEQLKNSTRTIAYSCKRCGRDRTDSWEDVPPEEKPEPKKIIGPPGFEKKIIPTIAEEAHSLGIAAQLKNGVLQ